MTLTQVTTGGVDENINIDSNTLKVDGTNNRVGIGTAAPNFDLQVHDSSGSSTIQLTNGTVGSTSADGARITGSTSGTLWFENLENAPTAFTTNNVERMRLDSAGRLLLGTTTEGEANADDLTVATSSHTGITIRSGTSHRGNIYFSDGTSGDAEYRGYIEYNHDGDTLKLGTANSVRATIDSAGRFLVGTTSLIDSSTASNFQIASSSGPRLCIARNNSTVTGGNLMGALDFYGNDSNGAYEQCARIVAEADGTHGTGDKPTRLALYTTASSASSATERVRIDSSGRVGIGVSSPDQLLTVNGGVGINNGGGSGGAPILTLTNVSGSPFINATSNATALTFGYNSTEKMRLDSSGRLLVNTTTSRIVEDHAGNGPQGKIQIEATNSDAIMSIISAGTSDANRCGTLSLGRHRNSTVGGTPTVVQNGDALGAICFAGGDGTDMRIKGAKIVCEVDGTPGSNDVPARLMFSTRSDGGSLSERMRITSAGHVSLVADNQKLLIGAGDDIQMYHDGSNSYIESVTGDLNIQAVASGADDVVITAKDDVYIRGQSGENGIIVYGDASVDLFYNSVHKFSTTSSGITVQGSVTETSDINLKKNIEVVSSSTEMLSQLRGVKFTWKENDEKSVGVIAQEVEAILPELVKGEEGNKSVNYSGLVGVLIEALKETITKIETLEAKVAALEAAA